MSSATIDTDTCAACGKGGVSLKSCGACKLVKYCSRECQANHRKLHKKECKKRAADIYDEVLFNDPPLDECPICFLILPRADQRTTASCCGKTICNGCVYAMRMSEGKDICAFCRTPPARSDEEEIKRTKNLMDKGNAEAYFLLAGYYATGSRGLPQNHQKANELCLKAGKLGSASAYYNLGNSYNVGVGLEVDKKKAKHYFELAAINGYVHGRHNVGAFEGLAGNHQRAIKHYIIASKAGHENSLDMVKLGFMDGLITKDEYATTLRAYQRIQDEMKSDERDRAACLKENGLGFCF